MHTHIWKTPGRVGQGPKGRMGGQRKSEDRGHSQPSSVGGQRGRKGLRRRPAAIGWTEGWGEGGQEQAGPAQQAGCGACSGSHSKAPLLHVSRTPIPMSQLPNACPVAIMQGHQKGRELPNFPRACACVQLLCPHEVDVLGVTEVLGGERQDAQTYHPSLTRRIPGSQHLYRN